MLFPADPRLAPLLPFLKTSTGSCPFIASGKDAQHVLLTHYAGGHDATYVIVQRTGSDARRYDAGGLSITIGYAAFVEGTTLIYDLVAEQMQGKARPFECDLRGRAYRVYAVLPYQIERTSVIVEQSRPQRSMDIRFVDARDEPLAAALPFQWRLSQGSDLLVGGFAATSQQGRCRLDLPSNRKGNMELVVRSLLTGHEEQFTVGG